MSTGCGRKSGRALSRAAFLALEMLEGRRLLSAGSLDSGFSGGVVTTDFPGPSVDVPTASVQLTSGKLLVVGASDTRNVIARYNANGSRDTSFGPVGSGGAVYIPNSVLSTTDSVAVDGSGNLLVGGTDASGNGAIARFTASGTLDGSFGSSGVSGDGVTGNISGIVTIGSSIYGMVANTGDFTAVKFDNSGNFDSSFGSGGVATWDGGDMDTPFAMVAHNGGILLAGDSIQPYNSLAGGDGPDHAAFVQFDNGGSLDASFNGSGVKVFTLSDADSAAIHALHINTDGTILAAGTDLSDSGNTNFFATRLTSTGSLDTSFGTNGSIVTNVGGSTITGDTATGLVVDSTGRILLIGQSDNNSAIERYSADGAIDLSYNVEGIAPYENLTGTTFINADDSLTMVTSSAGPTGDSDFAQVSIDANGALNTSFGNGGIALDGFSGPKQDSGNAVAQQGDGKLIVAGTTSTATGEQLIALARYNTDGSLDTSFDGDGKTTLAVPGSSVDVRGVAVSASGKIYVAFTANSGNPDADDFAVAAFTSAGAPDSAFGSGGVKIIATSGENNDVVGIALSPDGSQIYVAGNQIAATNQFEVAALGTSGNLLFDTDIQFHPANAGGDTLGGIAVQPAGSPLNGAIVLAGTTNNGAGAVEFAIARVDSSNGSPIGQSTTSDNGNDFGGSVAVDSAGNIYVAGYDSSVPGANSSVIKFDSNGNRITTGFGDAGNEGVAHVQIKDGAVAAAIAIAIAPNGQIVIGGTAPDGANMDFGVANFNSNGSVDTTFGTGGVTGVSVGPDTTLNSLLVQADGKIVAAGTGNDGDFALARFNGGVTITNVPPSPAINGAPASSPEGTPINLTSTVTDPDSTVFTYQWTVTKNGVAFGSTGTGSSYSFTPVDEGTFVVTLTVSDGIDSGTVSKTINVKDVPPILTVSGASTTNEGAIYTLNLGWSDSGPDIVDHWTINWRDGTIDTVAGSTTSVTHVYADDRAAAFVITTSATDEDGTYTGPKQSVTVQNLPPTVSISGPTSPLVSPQLGTFTLTATDPSSVDQAAKFTFHIDWDGDGVVDQNITALSGTQVTHAFPGNGAITVSVTATDKDGGTSATAASTVVNVTGVSAKLTSDPLNSGQQMLLVNGTSGDDNIKLTVNDNKDTVSVSVSNVLVATFTTTATFSSASRIAVYGNDGNDIITHGGGFNRAVELYGGNGNDTLNAGTNGDILVGGLGDDSLNSGLGNDLLIGGGGADKLVGGGGEDILVAGSTSFDNDPASLNAIMAEWQSSRSFTSRIANLMDNTSNPDFASRANGNVFLLADASNATVVDDSSKDTANGGDGNDWLLVNISGGTVVDKVISGTGDVVTDI